MSDASRDYGPHELCLSLGGVKMFFCLASAILMGLGGIAVYLYYLRKGQFDDPEDVKYQMFRDPE